MIEIVTLASLDGEKKIQALGAIEEIFFLSTSVKSFASEEKRQSFYKKWCGDFQRLYPDEFFLAYEEDKLMGYLSGCSDSARATSVLEVPGYKVFEDLFSIFPAHLHINFHPDARGKGLGSLLVKHYMQILKERNIKGLHLITSQTSANVSFYSRLGFNKTYPRDFNGSELFFMGCILE